MRLLPFQPAEQLSEVLGSGDVLVALLEPGASKFSIPSKVLSYLAAGRPVLGIMPADNPAAVDIDERRRMRRRARLTTASPPPWPGSSR